MIKRPKFIFLFVLILSFAVNITAQVKIKEIPNYKFEPIDSTFHNFTSTRKVVNFCNDWRVFIDGEEKKFMVSVPSTFSSGNSLVFEKTFSLTQKEIVENRVKLQFYGINYAAEISLNKSVFYKNPGGAIPFSVELPRDILRSDSVNILSVKIMHSLDSETTIPLKSGIFFPENEGGIFRDVLMFLIPDVNIAHLKVENNFSKNLRATELKCFVDISKEIVKGSKRDTVKNYELNLSLFAPSGKLESSKKRISVNLYKKNEASLELSFNISNPTLWSPKTPLNYMLVAELSDENGLVDKSVRSIPIYSFLLDKEGIKLNGNNFVVKGVTYFQSYGEKGTLSILNQLEKDLKLIKSTGFNAVRFSKAVPNPYVLRLCEKLGLLSFVEIPINSLTENLAETKSFEERAIGYSKYFIKGFEELTSFSAIGLGGAYLANSQVQETFLSRLSEAVKARTDKIVYTSFLGYPTKTIENIDLYGIELYGNSKKNYKAEFEKSVNFLGKEKVFISEITYPTFRGSTSGYENKNSFEAQAKYYKDVIDFSALKKVPAFFINTMFDYRGYFSPFSTGYNPTGVYNIGILGEDRISNRVSYNVVTSKLKNGEKVTIPMGEKKHDSPTFFIILGLVIAIILGLLINSKRKFREDATRALLRPYNFYADIRDQRILSGFHSNILMIILSGSNALLLTNILFFLKDSFFLERVFTSLGIVSIVEFTSYLAWNPLIAFPYIFIISYFSLILLSFLIYFTSFFVKNRVLFSSVYYMVTWSFLPLALLIPVELVLYRILSEQIINIYIYAFIILYGLWIFQRLIKGIYVIFDVRGFTIYFYSLLLITIVLGGILLYFQISSSAIFNIINTYKQYIVM